MEHIISHVQNILFKSSQCPFQTRGCGNNISSLHHYSIFFMTTMVNMLNKSEKFKKSKNNKKNCDHMPSQLISFYLLISLEGKSTLIRSQGHQIESFFCSVSVLDFALAFSLFLSSRALLSSALSKRFFL